MTTDLRELVPADWDRWFKVFEHVFGGVTKTSQERVLWRDLSEFERFVGAWDEDECVATAGAFRFGLTVPGGARVDAAGVTMVSVAPTHRRRGLLSAMMRRQLDDVRAWGEPLAVLTASEPPIYGRFGYAAATQELSAEIDTARVRIEPAAAGDASRIRLRQVRPNDPAVQAACEKIYAAQVPVRPGMIARAPGWERLPFVNGEREQDGMSPLQCVLVERDGEVAGFTLYRVKPEWDRSGPKGTVELRELYARDAEAYGALWRFLFGIDLTSTIRARNRPLDDPFQHLVSDVRRCGLQLRDALYVRLVEVGAALEARTYRTPVDVVVEVEDTFCPWNEGRWRLTGDPKGASCVRTADQADLALSVRELGAAYLGGVSLVSLAGAGRVTELRPGALAEASTAFGSDVAPWLPHGF
ncbi:GNAT family N-acetyltransferase [Streptomyces sp. SID3212]|uniref:GNAT family N-acetyltransferase n=1 Tax=unclassified Streptomyces TaxID=2593676 RepID=UPI00136F222A|nr:GNAT family N-acetyltransferase [Streptomyces sp. SID3212]MYV56295.1 GNAT family N-acetyltransferase [Streptomyces sp. SID3212]